MADAITDARAEVALREARAWIFECWGWLMETDLDMTCPMQTDPLDIVEKIDAILGVEAAMQAARQPQVPAEDVVKQIAKTLRRYAAAFYLDYSHSTIDEASEKLALYVAEGLTALQVTEGDKVERRVEAAYREGHCDGRDLARTGRQGSECMDWLDSETHAALHSKQEGEGK